MFKKLLLLAAAVLTTVFLGTGVFASNMMGGWEMPKDVAVTEEARTAFDAAMEGYVGVKYEPLALLGTQVVSGTNYCLLCRAETVTPNAIPYYTLVYVYQDLQGNARVLDVDDVEIEIDNDFDRNDRIDDHFDDRYDDDYDDRYDDRDDFDDLFDADDDLFDLD